MIEFKMFHVLSIDKVCHKTCCIRDLPDVHLLFVGGGGGGGASLREGNRSSTHFRSHFSKFLFALGRVFKKILSIQGPTQVAVDSMSQRFHLSALGPLR